MKNCQKNLNCQCTCYIQVGKNFKKGSGTLALVVHVYTCTSVSNVVNVALFLQGGKLMDMKKEEAEKKVKGTIDKLWALKKKWMAKLGDMKV